MTERQKHIECFDLMLKEMNPPQPFRAAIIAARNMFMVLEAQEQAGITQPDSWPYCSKCGRPYKGAPTNSNVVRDVVPDCECHAYPVLDGRPVNNEWEYTGQGVTDWEQVAKAGGVEMAR